MLSPEIIYDGVKHWFGQQVLQDLRNRGGNSDLGGSDIVMEVRF